MTAEQQARDLLSSMGCVLLSDEATDEWAPPENMSAGELVELANLIRDGRRKDRRIAELEAELAQSRADFESLTAVLRAKEIRP